MSQFKHTVLIGSQRDVAARGGKEKSAVPVIDEQAATPAKPVEKSVEKNPAKSAAMPDDEAEKTRDSATALPREKVPVPRLRGKLAADLEQEFDAIFSAQTIDEMMVGVDEVAAQAPLEPDAKINGKVLRVTPDEVFIDLGRRDEGVLSRRNLPPEWECAVGDMLDVTVLRHLTGEGLYELSMPLASADVRDWSQVREGLVVDCLVTKANTGGLECQLHSLRGFIPMSQIALFRVEKAEEYVGQKLTCVVTEADSERRNLVLSRRAMLEREREELREQTKAALEVGQVREGVVRKLIDAGAFVDLGGVDGFIPIGSLAWGRVNHPRDVLAEGQHIKVRIGKIDWDANRISLVYRDDSTDPWQRVGSDFAEKTRVTGRISRVLDFGAFVELAPGIEGLVHISELAHKRIGSVGEVVSEGDYVEVLILSIDRANRRIGLSIKGTSTAPVAESAAIVEKPESQAAPVKWKPQKSATLQGGTAGNVQASEGERFGLKW